MNANGEIVKRAPGPLRRHLVEMKYRQWTISDTVGGGMGVMVEAPLRIDFTGGFTDVDPIMSTEPPARRLRQLPARLRENG
jgi:hypothetical protein